MFHMSDETLEALRENKPGAHAMHKLHNLIHQAEHTMATPGGDEKMRNQYVASILADVEILAARAINEVLGHSKPPAAPQIPGLDPHHPHAMAVAVAAPVEKVSKRKGRKK